MLASQSTNTLRLGITDAPRALTVLREAGHHATDDGQGIVVQDVADGAVVNRLLAQHDLYASWLMPEQVDLEDAFLRLTEGAGLDQGENA